MVQMVLVVDSGRAGLLPLAFRPRFVLLQHGMRNLLPK